MAPALLGSTVSHAGVTVRLTEVEAYDGPNDPGSHAFRGATPRTKVMFGQPGGLYVYFTYGMHWCANLVCGQVGVPSAVLLRAGEVVAGIDEARKRRAGATRRVDVLDRDLARGPARLARAMALGRDQNGIDTVATGSPFVVRPSRSAMSDPVAPAAAPIGIVRTGPRVGVSGLGGDAATYPWRFWLDGEATVSAYRPGTAGGSKPPASPGDR